MNEDTNQSEAPLEPIEKQNNMLVPAIVAIVLVIGGAFLLLNKSNTTPSSTNAPTGTQNTVTETVEPTTETASVEGTMTDGVRVINVEAGSFYFKPNEIKVKKGEKVKVILSSKDMMHDFYIDELNVKLPITKSGTENSVEFTASKVGTFEFYCSVGQHRKMGQVGKFIVE